MHLTIIPEDQAIYFETIECQHPNRRCHVINNDSEFWASVPKDIHAIQYHSDGQKEIEYKVASGKGNVPITDVSTLDKYIERFNLTEQTYQSQVAWDKNNFPGETSEQKVTRLGPRP